MSFLGSLAFRLGAAALLVALCAILWFRGSYFKAEAARSNAALDAAIEVNGSNAAAFDKFREESARRERALVQGEKKKSEIRREADARKKEIHDAPPEADGPLAPVLRDVLDSLPKPQGFGPDRGDGAPTTSS